MPPMTITEFLIWLGSAAGATAALSFIAERNSAFQTWTASEKSFVMLVGSIVVAGVAYAVLTYTPPETLAALVPFFQIVYGAVASWLANQVAHQQDPANKSM